MSTPATLGFDDACSIACLLGEVCAPPDDHEGKKRRLLDGICRLVQADAWVWGLFVELAPGDFPSYVLHLHGGFDEKRLANFFRALEHPDSARFTAPMARLLEEKRCHVTRFRQQFDLEKEYLGSENQRVWQSAGIEPGVLSCRPVDQTTLSTIGIYRRPGSPAFTNRESRIAHILLSEVPWLHVKGWSSARDSKIPKLSPRRCTVMNFLVHGRSRAEIAHHLRLSRHTVDGYVKDVFRHFQAHSVPGLMARFQTGDGGDLP